MKKLAFFVTLLLSLLIAACGGTEEENLGGNVDSTEKTESATDNETKEESSTDQELNQVIVDNDNLKATLVKIVKKKDDIFGNSVEVIFDITNKRADNIEVQARSVSVDDRMVDETLLSMSQEVAAGKSATATLTINEYEGYEFPKFENNFEMTLHIFSWDDYDYSEDHPVNVTFN